MKEIQSSRDIVKKAADEFSGKYINSGEFSLFKELNDKIYSDFADESLKASDVSDDSEDLDDYDDYDDAAEESLAGLFDDINETEEAEFPTDSVSVNEELSGLKDSLEKLCTLAEKYGSGAYDEDNAPGNGERISNIAAQLRECLEETGSHIDNLLFFRASDSEAFSKLIADVYEFGYLFTAALNGGLPVNRGDYEAGKAVHRIEEAEDKMLPGFYDKLNELRLKYENDNPDEDVSTVVIWEPASPVLFEHDPCPEDIAPEYESLIADFPVALGSEAPYAIRNIFYRDIRKNCVTVKLYNDEKEPLYISVPDALPRPLIIARNSAGRIVKRIDIKNAFGKSAPWFIFLEKACAAAGLQGRVSRSFFKTPGNGDILTEKSLSLAEAKAIKDIYGEAVISMCDNLSKADNFFDNVRNSGEFNEIRKYAAISRSAIRKDYVTQEILKDSLGSLFRAAADYINSKDNYQGRYYGEKLDKAINRYFAADVLSHIGNIFSENEKNKAGDVKPIDLSKLQREILKLSPGASEAKKAEVYGLTVRMNTLTDAKAAQERRLLSDKVFRAYSESRKQFEDYAMKINPDTEIFSSAAGTFLYFDRLEAGMHALSNGEIKKALTKDKVLSGRNPVIKKIKSLLTNNMFSSAEISSLMLSSDYPWESISKL